MKYGWRLPAVLIASTLTACAHAPAAKPRLEAVPCWFEIPAHRQARCAWFYPGDMALGQAVKLPVVRIAGEALKQDLPPVLHVPGGPGYPAGLDDAGMRAWWQWRDTSRWPQEIWLYDPRGTGMAQPAIDCPALRASDRAALSRELSVEAELRNQAEGARSCYQRLGAEQTLAAFNSARQVRDIEQLMAVSGQGKWSIWAVSYGTRQALQLLRDPPQALASVVLDSAFPPPINGFLEKPGQFQRALEAIVAACAARVACAAQYPDLNMDIRRLFRLIQAQPWHIEFWRSTNLTPVSLVVTDSRLLWMLFFDSYLNHFDTDTAGAIARAAAGQQSALEPMAQRFVANLLDPDFSAAVYFSVTCAEDWPGASRRAFEQALQDNPGVARYFHAEWTYAVCRFWNAGALPRNYHQPVSSDVPTLFLSGEFDPATLPEWSRAAARRFASGHALLFAGASHALTFSHGCAMRSAARFLAKPGNWQPPKCVADSAAE